VLGEAGSAGSLQMALATGAQKVFLQKRTAGPPEVAMGADSGTQT